MQADIVLRPHRHVRVGELAPPVADLARTFVVPSAEIHRATLEPAMWRVVALDADDRLDARGARLAVELEGAVQVAVVGHGNGGLPQAPHLGEQIVQSRGTVEHGVLGVDVKVSEGVVRRRGVISTCHRRLLSLGSVTGSWCRMLSEIRRGKSHRSGSIPNA